MHNKLWSRSILLLIAAGCLATCQSASAQLLLRDDFDGTGNVDTTVWRLPFGSEGTFVGRTQYRGDSATDVPQQGIAEPLAADGAVMEVHLDTFSPIDPGNQFLGTDLLSKRNFARGGGLSFEARMRLKPTTTGGLVGGFFTYDVTRDSPPGANNLVRDEIDWELISNQTTGVSPTNDPFTNYWNEGPFTGPGAGGDGQYQDVAGLDLTAFHDYRVDWTPQSIKWYVDDNLVRTSTGDVPDDPMKLHFNLWAPGSDFSDAFNAALQPAATQGANERYTVQVDHVEVNRFNTTGSGNLLYDGSFEIEIAPTFIGSVPPTTTNTWLSFGNVSYPLTEGVEPGTGIDDFVPDDAVDGIYAAKMFGPFNGRADASGILQNVEATPGQEFEARVFAQTPGGDSIAGTQNFNTIALSFLDSSGSVIQEAFAAPGNLVDKNGKDFPLLDGRDPNMPEDLWVEGVVNAVAPAGAAYARISLFFIQLEGEGGATWFDDASLVLLTPDPLPILAGDYNGDGTVDAADYTVW
ncbi:MAG: glycoside hydrolase family 16 protein, partial [Planctomycetales bacterium]|nr:glycoside hydrolase family 16 protein [Planctomycetales bacterium]